MIVVKLMGGLGNQMFQYALGRNLAEIHQTTLKLDLSFLKDKAPRENFTYRDYDLSVFEVREIFASEEDRRRLLGGAFFFQNGIMEKIRRRLTPSWHVREKHFHFDESILKVPDNTYLEGYWQSEKYFKMIEGIIRKEFSFKNQLTNQAARLAEKIKLTNAVCLNVRRGDFVTNPLMSQFHGLCGVDYYQAAIEYFKEHQSDCVYYVFSDDMAWCEQNIKIEGTHQFVSHEFAGRQFSSYLNLMSLCKHFIIPNSTFGWWGAWLSANPHKKVIVPRKWFNDASIVTRDLIPEHWIKM